MGEVVSVFLKIGEWLGAVWRGQARREKELRKTHVVTAMRHAESKNPGHLVFSIDSLSEITGLRPSDLTPILEELEREGRVFWSSLGSLSGYSLHRMPWEQPGRRW